MTASARDIIFNHSERVAPLGLIAIPGSEELGKKVNDYLVTWSREAGYDYDNFLIENECPRFSSGDGKALIKNTVRGYDVYIIADFGNYSLEYPLFGRMNRMSPDDHFQNLKRIIQAIGGKAHRINVITPILYGGRQHRRNYRESLDCAVALQELQNMGVSNIIAFDAHDPRVCNAVPLMGFDNIIPTYQVLKALFKYVNDFKMDKDHFMVVSPDEGALNRNMYYSSVLGVDLGMFYKRRDYSQVVNGRNPIVAHEYLGNSVEGKDVFIADDIIHRANLCLILLSSLRSVTQREFLHMRHILSSQTVLKRLTRPMPTKIDYVFGTNLSYRTPELLSREWFCEVDVSKYLSYLIMALNHDMSISKVIDPHQKISALLEKHKND